MVKVVDYILFKTYCLQNYNNFKTFFERGKWSFIFTNLNPCQIN